VVVEDLIGQELVSPWREIGQERIDEFAHATDDPQWIHTDPEQAAAGPFGTTIAHGFLTLSLLPALIKGVYRIDGVKMGVNYGLNKVRFTSPVPVGSKIRAVVSLGDVTEAGGGLQVVNNVTVELEGSDRPALVAEWLGRQYF
jgi:acyl dehydratase